MLKNMISGGRIISQPEERERERERATIYLVTMIRRGEGSLFILSFEDDIPGHCTPNGLQIAGGAQGICSSPRCMI